MNSKFKLKGDDLTVMSEFVEHCDTAFRPMLFSKTLDIWSIAILIYKRSCLMFVNKKNNFLFFYSALFIFSSVHALAAEMIIGEENISPGINLIFEGAPKDTVHPKQYFRAESDTDIHIEMLANWSDEAPKGSPAGGFVAYLEVSANIKGSGGNEIEVKLTPHLNMSDNLHYAQNIKLPGEIDELYDVTFTISPPKQDQLGIHYDWNGEVGPLINETVFEYKNLDFKEIALSSRR